MLACGSAVALILAGLLTAAPTEAYGATHQWQVTISENCNNATLCSVPGPVGGSWVWAELDSGGTGQYTGTLCDHQVGGGPAGAYHENVDITGWTIQEGEFYLTSEIDTYTGHTGGPPVTVTIPSESFDTDVPAAAGHYSTSEILGLSAPGISFRVTVVAMH